MKKNIFFTFAILLILSGCEKVSKTDHQTEGTALEETFVRNKKRVIRYNCKGDITSDKIETINSVSKQFSLKPNIKTNLWDFTAKNVTTNSTKGKVWFDKGVFTLDLAPTVFNIKANEGMNEISWKFHYCNDVDTQNSKCKHEPIIKESGTLFIHIRHEVVVLEGADEIRPTAEECR